MKRLVRIERSGVHIVGCVEGTIAFGFTERTGGVSTPPFASLNLGAHVGDDPQAVAENRRRVLRAVGASSCAENLLVPNQVHSDHVAVVRSSDPSVLEAARAEIADGSDAIVCTAPDVPVMLCFADCVPVILTAPGGFADGPFGLEGHVCGHRGNSGARACTGGVVRAGRTLRLYWPAYPGRRVRGFSRAHRSLRCTLRGCASERFQAPRSVPLHRAVACRGGRARSLGRRYRTFDHTSKRSVLFISCGSRHVRPSCRRGDYALFHERRRLRWRCASMDSNEEAEVGRRWTNI